jgi:hypothetical protein
MTNLERIVSPKSASIAGLTQAVGLIAYIVIFVALAMNFGPLLEHSPSILAPVIFLTTFVTSALTCALIEFTYPLWLVVQGQVKEAIKVVAWSIAGLISLLLIIIIVALSF